MTVNQGSARLGRSSFRRADWQWQEDAECRGEDLVLFFGPDGERQPEREVREATAKRICLDCPVQPECLEHALTRPERYGVWGGMNEDERRQARRRERRRRAQARDGQAA